MDTLVAKWQVPNRVIAFSTTRQGGVSKAPFASLNLAQHVNDNPLDVAENRKRLTALLPQAPFWLSQTHSVRVVCVDAQTDANQLYDADALYTQQVNQPLAIMTADCLPVFVCSKQGDEVAVIHAGWRGLLNGVIENTFNCFKSSQLIAYLGAAIGPQKFEVGDDVKSAFCNKNEGAISCFQPIDGKPNKYLANIYQLARIVLEKQGVSSISGGEYCTVTQQNLFFSYRRDGVTGRNAHIIYIAD
ncbi:peptidoglycan editing factor PgeF [Pseudoalteromonas spongiae]|uniref:peptidoglycan editing factor PgeF n=1 Tax=Pseudoalteromonas spongiae TaxID=298657 RepID=UPI00026C90EA|nr:peptidoglycan editing factor PgeF [Pseudoalteromonas spongiae]ATC98139.1 yfiH [Pseudoalteromonas spongiae UST010723-006]